MEYSFKETKQLVYAIFYYFKTCATMGTGHKVSHLPEGDEAIFKNWFNVFYIELKEQKGDIKKTIIEIMGPYLTGSPINSSKTEEIIDLIFNKPLSDMLLYFESKIAWQKIIAQWRLGINK